VAASSNIVVTYAGTGQPGSSGDGGQAAAATIRFPSGVALDAAGDVFFADSANNSVRKVAPDGVISTVAGMGIAGDSGDGGPASHARLDGPTGLVIDRAGNLFIADTGNDRVRRVTTAGVITTVAGRGRSGDESTQGCGAVEAEGGDGNSGVDNIRIRQGADDARRADQAPDIKIATGQVAGADRAGNAPLCAPTGLAADSAGDVYIADTGNNRVREVQPDGTITTVVGTGTAGFSGNTGPATMAKLRHPTGLAVSGTTLFVSDTDNHQVRRVNGGTITAFAGVGSPGFSGDGGQASTARIKAPSGITADPLGNIYFVDAGNDRLRQVTASGVITTFAGTEAGGFSGDGGPAELARINPVERPLDGVTADASNVIFADTGNHRIRRIHEGGPPPALPEASGAFGTVLLPISGSAVLGGAVLVTLRRRRKRSRMPS
jgi:hypothetical protein